MESESEETKNELTERVQQPEGEEEGAQESEYLNFGSVAKKLKYSPESFYSR